MLLPYVLILSRAAGVELLELFCKVSKSWDLNTDLCRAILPSFVGSFSSTVAGGAVYDRWTACYIFLLNKIPANYTAQFYPSVLKARDRVPRVHRNCSLNCARICAPSPPPVSRLSCASCPSRRLER